MRPRWKLCILHPLTERKKKGSLCSFYAKFYLSWRKFGRYLNAPTKSKGVTTFYKYFLMVVLMLLLNRVPNLMFNLDRETWQRFKLTERGGGFPKNLCTAKRPNQEDWKRAQVGHARHSLTSFRWSRSLSNVCRLLDVYLVCIHNSRCLAFRFSFRDIPF